ncbi:hypothetical protein [Mycobacterium sp. 1274761.0]|uniref:hypothetical protein n=1 Tax=Mycobacterium sp. 1274761.0 TaxID=1834077 RepID=UPI0007FEFD12|nr:hypothetical protein [Mycobacterium sp. 1274761.0]OBK70373.1 hypothetical protein A5651_22730 [Mycobacterium sp. 1274761.0]
MALATLLAITIGCIGWSLWIRRVTWTCRWEVAATLNIALQGAAVLLMSPWASETLGHWLHALTGKWNLEDYLGHDCYIVAASAIVYNTLGRLADDDAMQRSFKQYVERPATLCIPLLLVTFSIGNGAHIYAADFFTVPTDSWLNLYWLLLCGMLIYLLVYGIRATLVLRKDPRSRTIANFYLASSVCGILACVVRITTAYIPALQTLAGSTTLVWVFACMCGAGFALASAHSWRIKTKWFTRV